MSAARPPLPSLWGPLFAGPVAWFTDLTITYLVIERARMAHETMEWTSRVTDIVALLVTVAAGALAWRRWHDVLEIAGNTDMDAREKAGAGPDTAEGRDDAAITRARFMAVGGIVTSVFFAALLLATLLPSLMLSAGD